MNRTLIPVIALAASLGLAALALVPTADSADQLALASAFPIAQATFAH